MGYQRRVHGDEQETQDVVDSIYETNILSMHINKTMDDAAEAKTVTEIPIKTTMETTVIPILPTEQPRLNIFNSTDMVLTKFTVNQQKEETATEETLVTSPSEIIKPTVISQKDKFSPTAIPTNNVSEKKRSHRRKLFRKQFRHKSTPKPAGEESTITVATVRPTRRPMLRKLVKSAKNPEVKEITIEEKKNPRKIIFRKGLAKNHRRRLSQKTKKDPLVASLLSQIKKQKSQLFRRKNRPRKGPKRVDNIEISSRTRKMKFPILSTKPGSGDDHTIDEMQDMEIMRKNNDLVSSTTVSSTTVLDERGNAETTTTIKDSTLVNDDTILTTVPASSTISSVTLFVDRIEILKSYSETDSKAETPSDSSEENTINSSSSDDINNEIDTESPDMYETSTVIATSISTSEAISYFNPENLPKLENV